MESGSVTETQMDDWAHAFPRVDDRVVGLKHRLWLGVGQLARVRAVGWTLQESSPATTCRTARSSVHDLGPSAHPGEFVFVQEKLIGKEKTKDGRSDSCTTTRPIRVTS